MQEPRRVLRTQHNIMECVCVYKDPKMTPDMLTKQISNSRHALHRAQRACLDVRQDEVLCLGSDVCCFLDSVHLYDQKYLFKYLFSCKYTSKSVPVWTGIYVNI